MNVSDSLVNSILKQMGVDPNVPPHWKPYMHKVIDQSTRELIHELQDGWMCSYCGKWSYYQAAECSGCGSIMPRRSEENSARQRKRNGGGFGGEN